LALCASTRARALRLRPRYVQCPSRSVWAPCGRLLASATGSCSAKPRKPYERQPVLQLYSSDTVGSPAADNASAAHRRRKNPVVQPLPIPLIPFRNRLFSPEMTVVFRAAPAAGIRGKFRVHGMFTLMVWESHIILLKTDFDLRFPKFYGRCGCDNLLL
jgi:hypothetical protein